MSGRANHVVAIVVSYNNNVVVASVSLTPVASHKDGRRSSGRHLHAYFVAEPEQKLDREKFRKYAREK